MAHRKLKVFLIELALGWAAQKHKLTLDPQYKLPRLAYKGVPTSQRIRVDPEMLIQEVSSSSAADDDGEVSFPLMPKRLPLTAPARPRDGPGAGSKAATASVPPAASPGPPLPPQHLALPDHAVSYEGRPVEWVSVRVAFPSAVADASSSLVRAAVLQVINCIGVWGGGGVLHLCAARSTELPLPPHCPHPPPPTRTLLRSSSRAACPFTFPSRSECPPWAPLRR